MIVGGRDFNWTKEDVERHMRGQEPEAIRHHIVKVLGVEFPPKQVLATVTGWDRSSFTTLEAQRVLIKLDFVCWRAGRVSEARGGTSKRKIAVEFDAPLGQARHLARAIAEMVAIVDGSGSIWTGGFRPLEWPPIESLKIIVEE